jgi:hypothetical protein
VWFLGARFLSSDPVARSCPVPAGTALFVPLVNNASLAFPADPDTPAQLRHNTRAIVDGAKELRASVDGRAVRRPRRFRATSPFFMVRVGAGNVFESFGVRPGWLLRGVADGYYIMLKPLRAGTHRLHVHGRIGSFVADATYTLHVGGPSPLLAWLLRGAPAWTPG